MTTRIDQLNGLKWEADDLNKKFKHTYVYAEMKNGDGVAPYKEVFFIGGVGNQGLEITRESDPNHAVLVPFSRFFVEEDRPTPCITNQNHTAFMFCWNPARQWRRGWCPDNSFLFYAPSISSAYGPGSNWGWEEAVRINKPNHIHLTEALQGFKENKDIVGRALNNRYWLLRKQGSNGPVQLFRRKCFIGSFIGNKFFISADAKIFKDELDRELPILVKYYAN